MFAHYLNPTARKFILLGLFVAIIVVAWPLSVMRHWLLCFFLTCFVLLSRN